MSQPGLAYSDDDGRTWTVDPEATWPGDSNFGQVSIVQAGDYLYFFGIPAGRIGGAQIARKAPEHILDISAYQCWDGATWVDDFGTAATVIPAGVGELSLRWNPYYKKWLMMCLQEGKYSIVLRTSDCLTGPWSDEMTVAAGDQYPQFYAPYMLPKWNDRPEIYFTMSLFGPYNVSLMQTSVNDIAPSTAESKCG